MGLHGVQYDWSDLAAAAAKRAKIKLLSLFQRIHISLCTQKKITWQENSQTQLQPAQRGRVGVGCRGLQRTQRQRNSRLSPEARVPNLQDLMPDAGADVIIIEIKYTINHPPSAKPVPHAKKIVDHCAGVEWGREGRGSFLQEGHMAL